MVYKSPINTARPGKKPQSFSQQTPLLRLLMGFIAVLCLLLSSCIIKSQLKRYLIGAEQSNAQLSHGNPAEAAHKGHPGQPSVTTTYNLCQLHAPSAFLTAGAQMGQGFEPLSLKGITLFLSSAFLLLIGGRIAPIKISHLHDNGKFRELTTLPLFLRHRRLLI